MFNLKKTVVKNHVIRKEYVYEKDGVTLKFALRTDVKRELSAFAELLEAALVEVKEDIGKVN